MSRCKVLCTSVNMYNPAPVDVTRGNGNGGTETYSIWPRQFAFGVQYDMTVPEDKRFCRATPTATIEITVDNPAVEFVPGRYYYVDFSEVPAP